MADVYKFRVKLQELEKYLWRDIEVSSLSTVAKLGYAILAAFQAQGSHLFGITYNYFRYEFDYDGDLLDSLDDDIEDVIPPNIAKLSSLKLKVGDKMEMEYDYGAGWIFDIELISISPMVKGTGTHYPYITDGAGWGIIEDTCPGELLDYIKQIDKTGISPKFQYRYMPLCEIEWDYRRFDIEILNALLKSDVQKLQDAYENFE
ncbi:MAG: plasmid pRiA4b ORF-3 family protein [Monoglobaceae bacterium]